MNTDPAPVSKPVVNAGLSKMNGLQRAAESIRYVILSIEYWISGDERLRRWLRRNVFAGAWLLIPALFVLPIVGLLLWQLAFWWSLFTGIIGKLILIVLLAVGWRMIKR